MKDNELIAEFMGMKYSDERSFNDGEWTHSIKSLSKFETSWDWLMPVMAELVKNFGSGWIFEEGYDLNTRYNAVVEFIKQIESKNPKSVKIYEKKNVIAGVDFSESINSNHLQHYKTVVK